MATVSNPAEPHIGSEPIPPLENGDHLTRDEFERRYHAMPEVRKAELIEGVVYMPSPVRLERHAEPHFELIGLLCFYKWSTPGVRGADNATNRLDLDNEPQPDVILYIDPTKTGKRRSRPMVISKTRPNSSPKSLPAQSVSTPRSR